MILYGIKGTGLALLDPEKTDDPQVILATLWIVFIYLPLIPLHRKKLRLIHSDDHTNKFDVLEIQSLKLSSLLKTWLIGLVLWPILLIAPLLLGTPECLQLLDISQELQTPLIFAGIAWFIFGVWKTLDWEEKRWKI